MLRSKSSSYRDFLSASDFGLNLVLAGCCQPSVPCDPKDAQSTGRAAAGDITVLSTKETSRVGFSCCSLGRGSLVQEPGHQCWQMSLKARKLEAVLEILKSLKKKKKKPALLLWEQGQLSQAGELAGETRGSVWSHEGNSCVSLPFPEVVASTSSLLVSLL